MKKKILIVGFGYIGKTNISYILSSTNYFIDIFDPSIITFEDMITHGDAKVSKTLSKFSKRLSVIKDYNEITNRYFDYVLLCLPTPYSSKLNDLNLNILLSSVNKIIKSKITTSYLILRSTNGIKQIKKLQNSLKNIDSNIKNILSVPEFLREGTAYNDLLKPNISVIGIFKSNKFSINKICKIIPINKNNLHLTSLETASIVKVAFNTWRAAKVAISNEFARTCNHFNVDPFEFHKIFISEKKQNISNLYLRPGLPFGGPCFEKDTKSLADSVFTNSGIINSIVMSNRDHVSFIFEKLKRLIKKNSINAIVLYSFEFKFKTNDYRDSSIINLMNKIKNLNINIITLNDDLNKLKNYFEYIKLYDSSYAFKKHDRVLVFYDNNNLLLFKKFLKNYKSKFTYTNINDILKN